MSPESKIFLFSMTRNPNSFCMEVETQIISSVIGYTLWRPFSISWDFSLMIFYVLSDLQSKLLSSKPMAELNNWNLTTPLYHWSNRKFFDHWTPPTKYYPTQRFFLIKCNLLTVSLPSSACLSVFKFSICLLCILTTFYFPIFVLPELRFPERCCW